MCNAITEEINRTDWFDAGCKVSLGAREQGLFPPLGDREAQRFWLGGFGAAWAERGLSDAGAETERCDQCLSGSVEAALLRALDGRDALLLELWAIGQGSRISH